MTSIAFTFLFGIKDITLDYMFPSSTTTKWTYNVIFYWYTGIISLLFIYFKQLKQMRKDYESEKTYMINNNTPTEIDTINKSLKSSLLSLFFIQSPSYVAALPCF